MTMDSGSLIAFDRDVMEIYVSKLFGREMPKPMMSYIKQLEKDLEYESGSAAQNRDEEFCMNEIKRNEPMYTDFTGMGRLLSQSRENNNPEQCNGSILERWRGNLRVPSGEGTFRAIDEVLRGQQDSYGMSAADGSAYCTVKVQ